MFMVGPGFKEFFQEIGVIDVSILPVFWKVRLVLPSEKLDEEGSKENSSQLFLRMWCAAKYLVEESVDKEGGHRWFGGRAA